VACSIEPLGKGLHDFDGFWAAGSVGCYGELVDGFVFFC